MEPIKKDKSIQTGHVHFIRTYNDPKDLFIFKGICQRGRRRLLYSLLRCG